MEGERPMVYKIISLLKKQKVTQSNLQKREHNTLKPA